ncbi:MAG: DUF6064 family protein [Gammaproteobacteria bacterium]
MSWTDYSLVDLVMFAPSTYVRMFALTNAAWWPVSALLGGALVITVMLAWREVGGERTGRAWARVGVGLAGLAMLNSAVVFLAGRFAAIFNGGEIAAWVYAIGGSGLLVAALMTRAEAVSPVAPAARHLGALLVVYGLFLHPWVSVLMGRPVGAGEWFALAPDPTAVVALGTLALAGQRGRIGLAAVPAAWLLFSFLLHLGMAQV